jgi:chromosome partitioning protein
MSVVAVVNQKGGVGKTTVTLNLAGALAASGVRVLVVDLDPQANATSGLGVWGPTATIDDVLADPYGTPASSIAIPSAWPVEHGRPDLVPSSAALANREPLLAADPIGAQDRLGTGLAGLSHDVVLVDCPPSLGLLTVNALFAADQALIVTEPAAWAADGVDMILATLQRVEARRLRPMQPARLVINRLGRTRDARYWHDQLIERHRVRVLPPVQMRTAVSEAAAQSLPVAALTRTGAAEAAIEFRTIAVELASDLGVGDGAPDELASDTLQLVQAIPVQSW